MKSFRYFLIAAVVASGPALAQSPASSNGPNFAMATQASINTAPGRADAVLALQAFTGAVQAGQAHAAFASHGSHHNHVPLLRRAMPAGFPLAVNDLADLQQARIGWGFAVYNIDPRSLLAGKNLDASARPTREWRYAILLQGKPVGLVTMLHTATGWKAVSFGGAGLSADLGTQLARYGRQSGAQLRFVRVPQAGADFIEVKRGTAIPSFVPLAAARASLHLDTASPRSGAELVSSLRQAVQASLAVTH
ncbi:MAG TPA: hypothetical protein VF284_03755 [Rhodanobacteraceae bacterium]